MELYLLTLHWFLTTSSACLLATVTHYLSRPWFFLTACLALCSEFFPHSISDAYILWLFSLFACYGMPPSFSLWRKHWWNVETFLQWFIPKILASRRYWLFSF